jgi:hypothetical protein
MYDSDNVIVYEITSEDGYVRFLHKGYGKESEHLRDKSEEDESQARSYILTCHREGKSVREIADLVNLSKTTVHRIITREKEKETVPLGDAVPSRDAGQAGQAGQDGTLADAAGQCVPPPEEPDPEGSFVFDLYDNFEF